MSDNKTLAAIAEDMNYLREVAQGMGYSGVLEALEDLDRRRTPPTDGLAGEPAKRLQRVVDGEGFDDVYGIVWPHEYGIVRRDIKSVLAALSQQRLDPATVDACGRDRPLFKVETTAYVRNADRSAEHWALVFGDADIVNDDGSRSITLRFPCLVVPEMVDDAENIARQVADILNRHWPATDREKRALKETNDGA